ncbi:MAG: hypothetical protein KY397_02740 [Gemmatimonadetes bacterium]|nr:hypothetical protein [Gemmatimonadota bacterium]
MNKFLEYRLFVESTQFLTERRQSATQVYVTVNTLIFAVLGFLLTDTPTEGAILAVVSGALVASGIGASIVWLRTIDGYRKLIGWRYDQLMDMERDPDFDCCGMFTREYEDFFGPEGGGKPFSSMEAWLPKLFIVVYIAYFSFILLMRG